MSLTEIEKRKIAIDYLNEIAKESWSTKVSNDLETDENERRNKKFCILYRAFCDGFLLKKISEENKKLAIPTNRHDLRLSDQNIEQNPYTKDKPEFWKKYRDLRNMITHTGFTKSSDFCYISEESLKIFEKEVSKFIPTRTAYSICTKNPYIINDQCKLSDVLIKMKKENFSNAPVIDDNEFAKGMFNANTLFQYANDKIEDGVVIDCQNTVIEEFKPLYEMNEQSELVYDFVAKTDDITKV